MLAPKEIADNWGQVRLGRKNPDAIKTLILAILAGAFIAFAAVGGNTVSATIKSPSVSKLVGACVFPVGLLMVILAGSDLFTGKLLLVLPLMEKKIKLSHLLRYYVIVYLGNFIGSIIVALMVFIGGHFKLFNGAVAAKTIATAQAKAGINPLRAIFLAIGCNILVCIAVWMASGAKTAEAKLAAIYLPIMLFVLVGFEHSVANMYYIPAGMLAAAKYPEILQNVLMGASSNLNFVGFIFRNLIPVTIGNIIGGALVAIAYWACYRRES